MINMRKEEINNIQKWIGTERRTLEEEKKKLKCNESKFKENLKESERKTIESIIK